MAAFLVWKLASRYSLYLSLFLVGMILANSQLVFLTGNTVGIVISLCVIAVWCFVENRFVPFGVLCLGLSLAVKPHDAGFVWLYFVLVGERYQRRALQALSLTVALGGAALLWVTFVAPHWLQNWLANMKTIAMPGGLNNPGPLSVSINFLGGVIDLQTVFALFKDDPHFYNSLSYLVSGVLLAIWVIHTLRKKFSPMRAWFALAAIAPITLFLTYHRSYDAKLLILTIPACAILWARGGAIKWTALLINFAGLLLTADFPLTILMAWARGMHFPESGILAQLSMAVLMRPAPIILLVMSIFYLWVYSMVTIPKTNSDQERMVSGLSGSKAAQSLAGSN